MAGTALLRTSWQAADSSKRTALTFDQTGTEVWLDHTAVTAIVVRDGQLMASLVNDGRTPRKLTHYRPLYRSLLSEESDRLLSFDTAAAIVRLLYEGSPER